MMANPPNPKEMGFNAILRVDSHLDFKGPTKATTSAGYSGFNVVATPQASVTAVGAAP